jgi:dTDP-4-dehydrorhamnose 3,5-epimerase
MSATSHSPAALGTVTLTDLRVIADERGAVLHLLRCDAPDFTRFGECYFSEIVPGAVKGWKRHRAQTQNIAVPIGRVRMVTYDERETSAAARKVQVFELGRPDAYRRVGIPPGIWYAFGCISIQSALLVNCADLPHDPSESETRALHDPSIPYRW